MASLLCPACWDKPEKTKFREACGRSHSCRACDIYWIGRGYKAANKYLDGRSFHAINPPVMEKKTQVFTLLGAEQQVTVFSTWFNNPLASDSGLIWSFGSSCYEARYFAKNVPNHSFPYSQWPRLIAQYTLVSPNLRTRWQNACQEITESSAARSWDPSCKFDTWREKQTRIWMRAGINYNSTCKTHMYSKILSIYLSIYLYIYISLSLSISVCVCMQVTQHVYIYIRSSQP